jgi:hypothetical protein
MDYAAATTLTFLPFDDGFSQKNIQYVYKTERGSDIYDTTHSSTKYIRLDCSFLNEYQIDVVLASGDGDGLCLFLFLFLSLCPRSLFGCGGGGGGHFASGRAGAGAFPLPTDRPALALLVLVTSAVSRALERERAQGTNNRR